MKIPRRAPRGALVEISAISDEIEIAKPISATICRCRISPLPILQEPGMYCAVLTYASSNSSSSIHASAVESSWRSTHDRKDATALNAKRPTAIAAASRRMALNIC